MSTSQTSLIGNKQKVAAEFNKVANRYDIATTMSQGYQFDLNKSAAAMELKGDERLLDLCCGTGRSTAACKRHIKNGFITGVDNSSGMIQVARQKYRDQIDSGKMEFLLGDAMYLDLPSESFDAAFTAYGLRNMPDYDAFIEGVHDVLKPGATFAIHDYCLADNFWSSWYWKILGYGFILPFCALMTRQTRIFAYLIKSVSGFLRPP